MSGKISFKIDRSYLARTINKTGTATEDRVFERFFFADSQIEYLKIKRQKPRREERPGMSSNTLSSVQLAKFVNNPG